jgi:hypothetical protein
MVRQRIPKIIRSKERTQIAVAAEFRRKNGDIRTIQGMKPTGISGIN